MELMPSSGSGARPLYYFRSSLLHVINGARVVQALQSTLAAVCFAAVRLAAVCFAASPQRGFFLLSLAAVLTWPRRSVPRVPLLFRPPRRQSRLQVSCGCVCRPLCGVGHVGATERVLRETRRSGFSDPRRAGFVIIRTLLVSA